MKKLAEDGLQNSVVQISSPGSECFQPLEQLSFHF